MSHAHLSATPMDPYQWRESVLSTRSLSYLSTVDAFGPPGLSTRSRSASQTQLTRRGTLNDGSSDYGDDLVMANTDARAEATAVLSDIPELPDSVAHCALFTLPREIRDRIYAFSLTARDSLPVEWLRLAGATPIIYALQPQLLRTCRIVHDEAAPLLYSLNNLTFHHPSDANIFVRAFASTALSRRHIQNLSLHLKAADTRLWMPYLTSTDEHRSLKADFPHLRELGLRYRSNRWNHANTPEQNLKAWCEDGRLDEIVDGLRHIYYPPPQPVSRGDGDGVKPLNEMNEEEFMRFVDARRPGEDMAFKRQLLELHKAHAPAAFHGEKAPEPPTVKVVCACRVHTAHFMSLTTPPADGAAPSNDGSTLHPPAAAPQPPAPAIADPPSPSSSTAPLPVQEGAPFHAFTPLDFRTNPIKRLHDPDLGSATTARTPFADRKGILIALEVHCLDLRGKSRERRA